MVKPIQPKNKPDKERAQDSRDDLDLPPLTPEEEAYEKACDAIVDARLVSKFGPKSKFTDEEILTAVDELRTLFLPLTNLKPRTLFLTRRTEQRAAQLHTTEFAHSLLNFCTRPKGLLVRLKRMDSNQTARTWQMFF